MRRLVLVLAFTLGFGGMAAAAPIIVAGTAYDTVNFADTLIGSSGSFSVGGAGSLASAVTDLDAATYAFSLDGTAYLELGFTDNVVTNGPGADLAFYEVGTPDNFGISLTVGGATQLIVSASTGFNAGSFGLNLATLDLSLLGVAPGASISSLVLNMGTAYAGTSNAPTLGALIAIYGEGGGSEGEGSGGEGEGSGGGEGGVPEPTTLLLLGAGVAAAGFRGRARRVVR